MVKHNPSRLDIKVAKHFDMLIGIYFSKEENRQAETLGEFLVACKEIFPDWIEEWIKET